MPTPFSSVAGKRVLVTGGAGFIGSHLVEALAALDPGSLVVADNFFLGKRENLAAGAARYPALVVEEVDTADLPSVEGVLSRHQVDVVFDLATLPLPFSLERPFETVNQITAMAANLAELARRGAFQTLVHMSSSEVYGSAIELPMTEDHPILPKTPYAAAKAAADHTVASYIDTFGIDALIIRPFNNYGPRQNEGAYAAVVPIAIRHAASGKAMPVFGDGEQTRDFMYVGDTVAGTLAAYAGADTRGEAFNLATGRETSVNEIVATIYELMGLEPHIDYQPKRPADIRQHCGSAAKAASMLGFKASTSLRDGLAITVDWYREHVL